MIMNNAPRQSVTEYKINNSTQITIYQTATAGEWINATISSKIEGILGQDSTLNVPFDLVQGGSVWYLTFVMPAEDIEIF